MQHLVTCIMSQQCQRQAHLSGVDCKRDIKVLEGEVARLEALFWGGAPTWGGFFVRESLLNGGALPECFLCLQ